MNSLETARRWVEFLARRPEFPLREELLMAWRNGKITRLCDCSASCQSFDFHVNDDSEVQPLWPHAGPSGAIFTIDFKVLALDSTPAERTLELVLFIDERGHFDGLDVMCSCNALPVPQEMSIHEPPISVGGALSDA